MKDHGIETEIIRLLSDVNVAPEAEFIEVKDEQLIQLNKPFYTIDSIYTKDIDDAIWIEKNENGFKLFVAIADVSSYVLPGDKQDVHAQNVGTSFYLPHNTVHMLDKKLAEDFCSLNPGVKKQSMVCEMQFSHTGELEDKKFYQAQIMSEGRLTYSDVDKIIEGINPAESLFFKNNQLNKMVSFNDHKEILESLKTLYEFTQINKKEDTRTYWVVESPEFHLGENGKIEYLYHRDETQASQKMVETAMLMANISAAEFLYEKYPQFGMFRNQVEPLENEFPKPATYEYINSGHWGLKTPFYTHFTSPIRRYCDLLVHRLIKNVISNDPKMYSNEELEEISQKINLQQYKSKQYYIKSKNLLIPQYTEELLKTNKFNAELTVVDFSETGIVCRNEQLIEIFIPTFKLEKDVSKYVSNFLPKNNEPVSLEMKQSQIDIFNKEWKIYTRIMNYTWTDERKNAMYQMSRQRNQNKPRQF